ncbi:MAG: 4-hydroxybenzoate solanesyltransferase [Cyanobacteria bacterium SID2]|nr:4-hydroxybenzoate solanesyltransferase [Cyanobacteria bacterium SID2]MBP0006134.1 4-hydroxybenzoate solanesyltransferase [Cyanobacteria bacterium SBC]
MLTQPQSEPTWQTIVRLLRWDKPAGRLILMVPALWALFLAARGTPPLGLVGVIVLGTLATSAAGCVANDLWDRDIDPQVERTKTRPLAARSLSVKTGIVVGIVALACAAGLALYLNPFTFALCVAAVPVILLYPAAKRVFPIPQLVLSIAWGFAVLISWSAVTGTLETPTGWLWGATVLWTLGFDTIYAMSDREDDRRIGINSSALFFGQYVVGSIAVFFAGTVACLVGVGVTMSLGWSFWGASIAASAGWTWQILRLRHDDLPRPAYGELFGQNVWIGFVLLLGMIVGCWV